MNSIANSASKVNTQPVTNKTSEKTGTLQFTVDWPHLSQEIAHHTELRETGGVLGLQILNSTLYEIGKLAVKRNDSELLVLLERIGVVRQ